MAFNPQIPSGDVPSGLSYSRGAGAGDRSAAYKGQAAGTILSGIGGAVSTALAGADEVVKQKIYNEVDAGTDAVQSLFGVDDATAAEGGSINPVELDKAKTNLGRLQNAYINGDIKPSHYFAKLNVMTKSLKARYPGYEREIDQTVSSITGTNPANALMSSLEQEAASAASQRDAAASKWFTYTTQNQEFIERAYPGYFTMPEDQRPSEAEVMGSVASIQAEDSRLRSISLALEADIKKGQLDQKNLVSGAREVAGSVVSQTVAGGFAALGNNYTEILKKLDEYQNNPESITPEALQELQMGTANLLLTVQSNLQTQLSTGPYAQLDNATRKEIIEGQIAPLQTMVDAINNEDYGLVKVHAAFIEATKNRNVAASLQSGMVEGANIIQQLQTAKDILQDDAIFSVWLQQSGALNAVTKSFAIQAQTNAVLGTGDTLPEAIKRASEADPKAGKGVLESVLESIGIFASLPNVAPNIQAYIYGDPNGTINQFKASQRPDVFATMYSPKYVAELQKMKENDPTSWAATKKEAMNAFTEQSRPIIAEINEMPEAYSTLVDVAFNRETGQLEVRPSGAFMQVTSPISGMAGPDPVATDVAVQEMIRNYQQLNKMLFSMKAVVEADGGDFAASVDVLLQSMGVRYSNPLSPDERDESPDFSKWELPTGDNTTQGFLSFVQSVEAPASFNQIYSDDGGVAEVPLDQMTIDEVIASQDARVKAGSASSATGGLQIMGYTLKGLKEELGLTGQEYFDEETQRALGVALLERRGLSDFRAGKITAEQFANNLAQEWAAFPLPNGKSYYSKVGKNRALTDRATFLAEVEKLRTPGGLDNPAEPGLSFAEGGTSKPIDVYGNIPDVDGNGVAGQIEKFRRWNPDPVANHEARLASVKPEMQAVVTRAQEISGVKFVVASGFRTDEEQKMAQEFGWSKTDESNHETAGAVDIWVLDENGQVTFDPAAYEEVKRAMMVAAEEQGELVDWGGNWKNTDIPHFEYKGKTDVASAE